MDQLNQRITTCQRILAQNPNSTIFASLADAYRKKGMLDKAHKVCEAGLKVHPHYGLAHLVMAKICLDMNLLDEAAYEVGWVSDHALPRDTVGPLRASLLLKRGRTNEAKEMLKELSLSQPENQQIIGLLRVAEERAKRERKGGKLLTEVIDGLYKDPGVAGVALVDREGLLFGGNLAEGDPEELAVAGASIYNLAQDGMKKMEFGLTQEIELTTTAHRIWLFDSSLGYLILLTEKEISSASIKLKVGKALETIRGG